MDLTIVGNGNVFLNPPGPFYQEDTSVHLLAEPASGWTFHHWNKALTGLSPSMQLKMDSDKNLEAVFVEGDSFRLDIHTIGEGQVLTEPQMDLYPQGTEVVLSAVSDTGWQFFEWSGLSQRFSAIDTLTMDSDKTILATFKPQSGSVIDLYPVQDPLRQARNKHQLIFI